MTRPLRSAIVDAHAVVVRTGAIDRALIDAAPELEIVSRHGVGYDAVDVEALTERGIPLTIAAGSNSDSVAEHAMFMILALAKNGLTHDRATREGAFQIRNEISAVEISEKNLLVIGFGNTGRRVASRAQAFGMSVYAYDPYVDGGAVGAAGCTLVDDFHDVLPEMDVVTIHTPFTRETEGMVGEAELGAMKSSAFIVNTARGGIIDEPALAAALERGAIAGAGLDVFVEEPVPPRSNNPLLQFDNVIVSPHTAGVSREAAVRTATMSVQNVIDFFDGRLDPDMVVNRDVLDHATEEQNP